LALLLFVSHAPLLVRFPPPHLLLQLVVGPLVVSVPTVVLALMVAVWVVVPLLLLVVAGAALRWSA